MDVQDLKMKPLLRPCWEEVCIHCDEELFTCVGTDEHPGYHSLCAFCKKRYIRGMEVGEVNVVVDAHAHHGTKPGAK